ncbi:MAG: hypothetical protein LBD97_09190 [Bifidobacteriaceae bacterium]|jgi:hypothetical protein|nr:hypothetical protein [Bifidobacteriaceae bacterium]
MTGAAIAMLAASILVAPGCLAASVAFLAARPEIADYPPSPPGADD